MFFEILILSVSKGTREEEEFGMEKFV